MTHISFKRKTCSSTSENWRELFFHPFHVARLLHQDWRVFFLFFAPTDANLSTQRCNAAFHISFWPRKEGKRKRKRKKKGRESKRWKATASREVNRDIFITRFVYLIFTYHLFWTRLILFNDWIEKSRK